MTRGTNPVDAAHFEILQSLFTIVMVLDRNLTVVYGSETLVKYLPVITEQPHPLSRAARPGKPDSGHVGR